MCFMFLSRIIELKYLSSLILKHHIWRGGEVKFEKMTSSIFSMVKVSYEGQCRLALPPPHLIRHRIDKNSSHGVLKDGIPELSVIDRIIA